MMNGIMNDGLENLLSEWKQYVNTLHKHLLNSVLMLTRQGRHSIFSSKSYLELYLEEEIATEGVIRNLDSFARFLQIASFSHGSVLSLSGIAREAGIKRSTLDAYFDIIEEMMIATRLPVFTRRAKRQLIGHDKFYFFDTGVFLTLRPKGPLDNPNEIDGVCLEGLVFQHLRAWNDYLDEPNELFFW